MNHSTFTSFDGASLFYRSWNAEQGQKTLIVLHRGHEHSGRLQQFACDPLFADYKIFAYDQRGLGQSLCPVSPRYMDSVRDLECFVQHLEREHAVKREELFIVANSIAAVIVAGWLHDFAPRIAGLAMLAPAFAIRLYVPFAESSIALATKLMPNMNVPSYVKSRVLTHDVEQQQAYDADPLITRNINGALLVDMLQHGRRLVQDAAAIETPTLVLAAEKDFVVNNKVQREFFVSLNSDLKEYHCIKGAYHGLLFESMRQDVYAHIARFAARCFARSPRPISTVADAFTSREFERMQLKMMPFCERMGFALQRFLLPRLGWLSKGMRVGLKHGFDSGLSLDYVYHNKPQGFSPLGKMMDKGYLNAIGWRGIRIRKQHLLAQIEAEITRRAAAHLPAPQIFDIAGGPGNYLIELKEKYPELEILINDFSAENVEAGRSLVAKKGLSGIHFMQGDCFLPETYASLGFEPDIVIVSGIFELFDDNEQVLRAVQGLYSCMAQGGLLIYTGQPWHPQLKMIAHVLNSHRGQDWVMRRRSQRELDCLFASASFRKENMRVDDFGIFTVSAARKQE